jgi:hypothetical protein
MIALLCRPEVGEEWEPADYVDYTTAPLLLVPPGRSLREVLLSQPLQVAGTLEQQLREESRDVQKRRWQEAPREVQERQGWWEDGGGTESGAPLEWDAEV